MIFIDLDFCKRQCEKKLKLGKCSIGRSEFRITLLRVLIGQSLFVLHSIAEWGVITTYSKLAAHQFVSFGHEICRPK